MKYRVALYRAERRVRVLSSVFSHLALARQSKATHAAISGRSEVVIETLLDGEWERYE